MYATNPLTTGLTLSITLIATYAVCAALHALYPEPGIPFVNAVFHSIDLNKSRTPESVTFLTVMYRLSVLAIVGLAVGTTFAWVHRALSSAHQLYGLFD
jgi:beta-lactamase regulating signal transducer with metallopeptidase domain